MNLQKFLTTAYALVFIGVLSGCGTTSSNTSVPKPIASHTEIQAPIPITPTSLRNERIDKVLSKIVNDGQSPGLSVLILENGKETYFGQAGYSDKEGKIPVKRSDIGRYYSMTKPIVGVALMRLYEQGKFKLDDPVSKYLPELADRLVFNGENPDGSLKLVPAKRAITIRDLMRHTAGFTYGFGKTKIDALYRSTNLLSYDQTNAEFISHLSRLPLLYQPGRTYHYSVAVDVQGRLIEILSGQTLGAYLQSTIFEPLGMTHTGFKLKPADKDHFTPVYILKKNGLVRLYDGQKDVPFGLDVDRPFTDDVKFESGGGGLVSTLDDYAKFAQMLLDNNGKIIQPETLRLMTQNQLGAIPNGDLGQGSAFGLDFAVKTTPQDSGDYKIPKGSFYWGGMAGTAFVIDPKNQLVFVLHQQVMNPNWLSIRQQLTHAIYSSK